MSHPPPPHGTSYTPTPPNRLSIEASPYLRQHQFNPVDWYPWGPEALDRARRENKAIFLSVGYSTCYWCHVMERQCFENPAIAAEMNRRFVNIKVDREERPDIDQLYMLAVQVLTRSGGWPMSVFLTPDLKPFYAGTYFPPDERYGAGRISFPRLLAGIDDAWQNRRDEIEKTGDQLIEILTRLSLPKAPEKPVTLDRAWVGRVLAESVADYDQTHGGFGAGRGPKFPRQTLLELMLAVAQSSADKEAGGLRPMLHQTLLAMARGGIRDHLGGGFHRYSTDQQWLIPHFEIMLYDNALLLPIYARAGQWTGDAELTRVAHDMGEFLLREFRAGGTGPFFTAMDAEVDGQEGKNYLWTRAEVEAALPPDLAGPFISAYGLDRGPNFADPHAAEHGGADHGGSTDPTANVLYRAVPPQAADIEAKLAEARQRLKAIRDGRPQPLLDDKVLTHWNGLAIAGLAEAGKVLVRRDFVEAAAEAADWLVAHHRGPSGEWRRSSRDGVMGPSGILDDYAAMGWGFWRLFEATGEPKWRVLAAGTADEVVRRFADGKNGAAFFLTEGGKTDIPVRQKVASDSPLPSGNALAIRLLAALGEQNAAASALAELSGWLADQAEAASSLVLAAWEVGNEAAGISLQRPVDTGETVTSPLQEAREAVAVRVERDGSGWQRLKATLFVRPGYHLTADDTVSRGLGLVGMTLEVPGARVGYPVAHRLSAEEGGGAGGGGENAGLKVYSGEVVLTVEFAENPPPVVVAALRYQACTDVACLPAVVQRLELRLSDLTE